MDPVAAFLALTPEEAIRGAQLMGVTMEEAAAAFLALGEASAEKVS